MSRCGVRVLLIDRHEASRIATVFGLKMHGHVCVHVSDETDAYDVLRWFQPNVLIFDVEEAGVARRLRGATGAQPMLIAISTQDEIEDASDAEVVDAFLTKPLDIHQLDRLLRREAQ